MLLPVVAVLVTLAAIVVLASRDPAKTAAPPAAAPPQPDSAAGAKAAAQHVFQLYTAGLYRTVYTDLVPSVRSAVKEPTWVGVHQRCRIPLAGTPYTVSSLLMAGQTAVVTLTFGPASETQVFYYLTGKWLWAPSGQNLSVYQGSVAHIVGQLKSAGSCK